MEEGKRRDGGGRELKGGVGRGRSRRRTGSPLRQDRRLKPERNGCNSQLFHSVHRLCDRGLVTDPFSWSRLVWSVKWGAQNKLDRVVVWIKWQEECRPLVCLEHYKYSHLAATAAIKLISLSLFGLFNVSEAAISINEIQEDKLPSVETACVAVDTPSISRMKPPSQ